MAREQKDNSGVLFQNHKRTTDKHPNMKGQCRIEGFDYWVSAWTKLSEGSGEKFLSLSFQPKDKQSVQQKLDETNSKR
jgi:hypothetical protein